MDRPGAAAVHPIGHGEAGRLRPGTGVLDADRLAAAPAPAAPIQAYGCNVGAGDAITITGAAGGTGTVTFDAGDRPVLIGQAAIGLDAPDFILSWRRRRDGRRSPAPACA